MALGHFGPGPVDVGLDPAGHTGPDMGSLYGVQLVGDLGYLIHRSEKLNTHIMNLEIFDTTWAFGCSHMMGTGMEDWSLNTASQRVYPNYLTKGVCHNHSQLGASNRHILQQVITNVDRMGGDDFVFILWTNPARFQYIHQGQDISVSVSTATDQHRHRWAHTGSGSFKDQRDTTAPTQVLSESKKKLLASIWMADPVHWYLDILHNVLSAQSILRDAGVGYLMCFATQPNKGDNPRHIRDLCEQIESRIDWNPILWEPDFYESRQHLPKSRAGDEHLGEQAHRDWAKLCREWMDSRLIYDPYFVENR